MAPLARQSDKSSQGSDSPVPQRHSGFAAPKKAVKSEPPPAALTISAK
jgi:hypothetical protein